MSDWQLKTPVAFLVFNRPAQTETVFEAIRQAKPPKLLVVADGPRANRPGEAEKCAAVRAIIDRVDWDCEVIKNYADANMGCKKRVSSGLNWVFDTVEEAIILEDDCWPHHTFFRFCEELLEKYRDDKRIMMICGTNILGEWKSNIQSYHFSHYGMIWGWASWRRAWSYYDVDMKLWSEPEIKNRIRDVLCEKSHYERVKGVFEQAYTGKVDTWDYQWAFTRFSQSGLSAIPAVNLITNIGFTEDATHFTGSVEGFSNLELQSMSFPLKEPCGLAPDRAYGEGHNKKFSKKSVPERIQRKLKGLLASDR
ncbi:MAG: glycosyltransferase family 2 protein [Oscillatoria princeps RMCB-10]|jgi:hypothetical protein|nr:glycosyltransferase family 2 protein [Oscillatoria princeps RMCB-10]